VYKTLNGPITAQVEITTRCNLLCTHCYNYWRQGKSQPDFTLTKELVDSIVNELIKNGVFRVVITGGEPFLYPDIAFYLAQKLKEASIPFSFNTNLNPLTNKIVERIVQSGPESVLTSLISFDESMHDSVAQKKGAFKRTVCGIKRLLEAGIHVGVNMVVTKNNVYQVYETGVFVASIGVKAFSATKAAPPANDFESFSKLMLSTSDTHQVLADLLRIQQETGLIVDSLEHYPYCLIGDVSKFPQLASRRCTAGVTSCTIGANGEIRPCSHAPISYGNIFSDGLSDAWQKMQPWRDGSLIPKGCKACKYLAECSGGCRVEALVVNGRLDEMDPHACGEDKVTSLPGRKAPSEEKIQALLCSTIKVPTLRERRESLGWIVSGEHKAKKVTFINEDTHTLLKLIQNRPPQKVMDLQAEFNLAQNSISFLYELLRRGVLETV